MAASLNFPFDVLSHFDGLRQTGVDTWRALCPSHDDHTPSLDFKDVGDRLLVTCRANCSREDVVSAAGLTMADLFRDPLPRAERKKRAIAHSKAELEQELSRELTVLQMYLTPRIAGRKNRGDRALAYLRPEWRPFPDETWEREQLAARRILNGLEALYGS